MIDHQGRHRPTPEAESGRASRRIGFTPGKSQIEQLIPRRIHHLGRNRPTPETKSSSRQLRPAQRQRERVEGFHGGAGVADALADELAVFIESCHRKDLARGGWICSLVVLLVRRCRCCRISLAFPFLLLVPLRDIVHPLEPLQWPLHFSLSQRL